MGDEEKACTTAEKASDQKNEPAHSFLVKRKTNMSSQGMSAAAGDVEKPVILLL